MKFTKVLAGVCSAFLLLASPMLAFADTMLPEGTVAGLPERLSVLDSEGISPNDKGEYFFRVEGITER